MASSVGSEGTETSSPNEAMQVRSISTPCDADKQPQPRRLCQPQDAVHSKRIDPPNACGRYIHKQETSRLPEYTYCGVGVRTDDGVVLKQVRARYVEGNEKIHEYSKISQRRHIRGTVDPLDRSQHPRRACSVGTVSKPGTSGI